MQRALSPYVATGVAIVGASVLVAAPSTAPPQEIVRAMQLAALSSQATPTPNQLLEALLQPGTPNVASLLPSASSSSGNIQYALALIHGALAAAPEQIHTLVGLVHAGVLTPHQALGLFGQGVHQLIDAIHAGPPVVDTTTLANSAPKGAAGAPGGLIPGRAFQQLTPEVADQQSAPQTLGITGANQDAEGPEVTPKKHRERVELNVFKLNPLDQNTKNGHDAAQTGSDGVTTSKHQPGPGMTPVRDLVKKVHGDDGDQKDSSTEASKEAAAS